MSNELKKEDIIDILKRNQELSQIKDIDSLLDRVLLEARSISGAEAGSIYLKTGDKLTFDYVQNDRLMKHNDTANKYLYSRVSIPIDTNSIAGYVALNKTELLIDDVYKLDSRVPYTFNRSFDESSSYRTQSILTVPLVASRETVIGVMQIINAQDDRGRITTFSLEDQTLVTLFANQAAVAIERARMTRDIILRMVKLAEWRDPLETTAHVQRVAAYSIEIYKKWALRAHIPASEIERITDIFHIASMLHDVGKVAVSDIILKKEGRLTDEERAIMQTHTVQGARLFQNSNSDWDDMAAEIALNHHEKWDGTGYPGHVDVSNEGDISGNPALCPQQGKKGEEIPFLARIVALADVYDALISTRSYKKPWPEPEVMDYIQKERGKHFDPALVDVFFDIYDVIRAIREKFSN
ncbi:MAG: HD domain-containing phosphohydrolase [Candidatus Omnitrophota bacterium]